MKSCLQSPQGKVENTSFASRLFDALSSPFKDSRGSAAILFGVVGPVIVGITALSVDVVSWYLTKRELQSAADMVAITGAQVLSLTRNNSQVETDARADFTNRITGRLTASALNVQTPPQSGSNTGDPNAVKAILSFDHPLYIAGVIMGSGITIRAESVASIVSVNNQCVLALDPTSDRALNFSGNGTVDLGCGATSNSQSDEGFYVGGQATLTSTPVASAGDIYINGSATLNTSAPMRPYSLPVNDPYAGLSVPNSLGACTDNNLIVHGTETLSPGRYCNGIRFNGGANVTFQPGTYYIDGGDFIVNGGATLSGNGVTFVLTGSGSNYSQLNISGGADLSLSAPDAGSGQPYEGVLFFQDRNAPSFQGATPIKNKLLGGANLDITGAIYFPKQALDFTGGVSGLTRCLQLVAREIEFSGDARILNNCTADDGVGALQTNTVKLVE